MFAKEGYRLITGSLVLGALLVWAGTLISAPWNTIPWIAAFVVVGFTLYFFRDPKRHPAPETDRTVLAPADGKVVVVDETDEPLFLKSKAKRVSIFLSPLNVHVNRIPVGGTIDFVRYVPGDYLVAWHPKASELNERSEIGLVHGSGVRIMFKQIAGAVARRIVFHVAEGDRVETGERFGIVKFGSRMDVLMPLASTVTVQPGDRVHAGESVIAELDLPDVGAPSEQSDA